MFKDFLGASHGNTIEKLYHTLGKPDEVRGERPKFFRWIFRGVGSKYVAEFYPGLRVHYQKLASGYAPIRRIELWATGVAETERRRIHDDGFQFFGRSKEEITAALGNPKTDLVSSCSYPFKVYSRRGSVEFLFGRPIREPGSHTPDTGPAVCVSIQVQWNVKPDQVIRPIRWSAPWRMPESPNLFKTFLGVHHGDSIEKLEAVLQRRGDKRTPEGDYRFPSGLHVKSRGLESGETAITEINIKRDCALKLKKRNFRGPQLNVFSRTKAEIRDAFGPPENAPASFSPHSFMVYRLTPPDGGTVTLYFVGNDCNSIKIEWDVHPERVRSGEADTWAGVGEPEYIPPWQCWNCGYRFETRVANCAVCDSNHIAKSQAAAEMKSAPSGVGDPLGRSDYRRRVLDRFRRSKE